MRCIAHDQFNCIQSPFLSTDSKSGTPLVLEVESERGKVPVLDESPSRGRQSYEHWILLQCEKCSMKLEGNAGKQTICLGKQELESH